MSEYEYDHVFLGTYEGAISPNPEEVAGWTTISAKHVRKLMHDSPERFTYWFRKLFVKLQDS